MPVRRIMSGQVNRRRRRRKKKISIWLKILIALLRGTKFKTKIIMTGAAFALCFVGIIAAVASVAYGNGDVYKKKYLKQQTYNSKSIICKRGDISDRRGVALAKSVLVYNFVLEPRIILSKEADYREPTVKLISEYFGIS